MPRIAVYLKRLQVKDGVVSRKIPGTKWCDMPAKAHGWAHGFDANYMQPKEVYLLSGAGLVRIEKLTEDKETGKWYDLGETLESYKFSKLEIRQFKVIPVQNSYGEFSMEAVVLADIVF